MDLTIESSQLVATVFGKGPEDDPFKGFRDFLRAHMISFASSRVLKNCSAQDPLVVMEYKFAFESSTSGDLSALRKAAYEWSKTADVDVAIQRNEIFRRYRRLVVFDMDSTLIKQEVIDEIALYLDSVKPEMQVGAKVAVPPHPER